MPALKYWKLIVLGALILFLGFQQYRIQGLSHDLSEFKKQALECQNNQKLAEEVSRDYQSKISSLNSQLNKLRRVQSRCVVPSTPGYNGSPSGRELSGANGISTGWLLEYAGSAEETRLKLIACQEFLSKASTP